MHQEPLEWIVPSPGAPRTALAELRKGAETAVDLVRLAKCDPQTLCAEAAAAGFDALDPRVIEPTREHAGSEIVCLGVPA